MRPLSLLVVAVLTAAIMSVPIGPETGSIGPPNPARWTQDFSMPDWWEINRLYQERRADLVNNLNFIEDVLII